MGDYGEKVIDTGAGFLLTSTDKRKKSKKVREEFVMSEEICSDCGKTFNNSFLRETYAFDVCDECNDSEKYPLMTLSEVKSEYLLNDNMLKRGDDTLKFLLKKNPHNSSWGEMKLFLMPQVENLALKIWESWEKLDEEKEKRKIKNLQRKQKAFDKKLLGLKKDVSVAKYKASSSQKHEHDFSKVEHIEGPDKNFLKDLKNSIVENLNFLVEKWFFLSEKGDMYKKTCECGVSVEYEEM